MKEENIKEIKLSKTYFHYTSKDNLNSIVKHGLKPRIGRNSRGIERTKKIFFCVGDKGVLILMDIWIKWLVLKPKSDLVYYTGGYLMASRYFPKRIYNFLLDNLMERWIKNEKRIDKACRKLHTILEDSVFLSLDLKNKVDFTSNDLDEVKIQNYSKRHLKYFYSKKRKIKSKKIEPWNMHTYSNIEIISDKITLVSLNGNYKASNILKYIALNKKRFVKNKCPFLLRYLKLTYNDIKF